MVEELVGFVLLGARWELWDLLWLWRVSVLG